MSLVSAWARNLAQMVEIGEAVETDEIVEIASIDAVFMDVTENIVGWRKGLGEYPTLSATSFIFLSLRRARVFFAPLS